MRILLLLLAAAFFAIGGLCMKYSEGLTRLPATVALFLLFGFGAACQARAMVGKDMGPIYIVVLGLEAMAASLLSVLILHERMSILRVAGIVVIVIGIGLIQRS